MPIDRPDGRHWCAPDQEQPDESGIWMCPGCQTSWTWMTPTEIVRTADVEAFVQAKAEVAVPPVETKED